MDKQISQRKIPWLANALVSSVILVIVLASVFLLTSIINGSPTNSVVRTSKVMTSTTDPSIAQVGAVTNVSVNDSTPPTGSTLISLSGSGTRSSRPIDLSFLWSGVWSVDCIDTTTSASLSISLSIISATNGQSITTTSLLSRPLKVGGISSGTFLGKAATLGRISVSSGCDWSVSIIRSKVK
ncbi:hypothetical protein [Acidithrix ferrooxidans]|uniref:hypothetical protein n=1 Tax=Acidithrix ferrooxidans TaxID=1280514 RepID=UPI000695BA19|nr:hypothetical protein [Acidithrix ferrooxidans]